TGLSVRALTVSYSSTPVLANLDLEVEYGTVVGVLGANGSGKSTLLRTIACLRKPDSGAIDLDGVPVWGLRGRELARKLAYLPQQVGDTFAVTVGEAVMLGRTPHIGWRPGPHDRAIVADVL